MSAYIVEPELISIVAKFAHDNDCYNYGPMYGQGVESLKDIVKCLVKANFDSVNNRYGDSGDYEPFLFQCMSHANKIHQIGLVQLAKSVNCLEYQCCEPSDWYQSTAYKILCEVRDKILNKILKKLPDLAA